jgi:hypothetical protein
MGPRYAVQAIRSQTQDELLGSGNRSGRRAVGYRADRVAELMRKVTHSSDRAVLTFEVRRVYKGMVGKRQEVVTSLGPCSGPLSGPGPFLIFANKPSPASSRQYQLDPGQYTLGLGSRALADGGEPALGWPGWSWPPLELDIAPGATNYGGLTCRGTLLTSCSSSALSPRKQRWWSALQAVCRSALGLGCHQSALE